MCSVSLRPPPRTRGNHESSLNPLSPVSQSLPTTRQVSQSVTTLYLYTCKYYNKQTYTYYLLPTTIDTTNAKINSPQFYSKLNIRTCILTNPGSNPRPVNLVCCVYRFNQIKSSCHHLPRANTVV